METRDVKNPWKAAAYGSVEEVGEITRLLEEYGAGRRPALDRLLTIFYGAFRVIARRQLRGERRRQTLDSAALVHEAYLKLAQIDRMRFTDRTHLFAVAAQVMRRVLVDYAIRRKAEKRGGGQEADSLEGLQIVGEDRLEELVALDELLERLEAINGALARVVECRVFAGMSIDETAGVLGVSAATVKRHWQAARAWLGRELRVGSLAS
ncbi:MAG: sigma-70 family RNA polymerase sigma factor [Acidobacteria bacterium]|nr:sigma-70 family RNA polymerase sigma factor [Acidobacteriota bacterium]